jgi:hypothetical protein
VISRCDPERLLTPIAPSVLDEAQWIHDRSVMVHRFALRLPFALSLVLTLGACDPSPAATDAGPTPPRDAAGADAPRPPFTPDHTFPAIELTATENEVQGICQSWTLNNPEPIYVNAVVMDAGEGWHHSNWAFVGEEHYDGPDGTWPCRDRDFSEIAAAIVGGGAFFGQSTQSTHEEQRFPPGTAYVIPPYSRVIGSIHVLNFSGAPLSTELSFHIEALPEAEVTQVLEGVAIDNYGIEILPHADSESMTECDLAMSLGVTELDFNVYYLLPHYHGTGTGMRVEIFGGPNDGALVYETSLAVGDPLGGMIDPPISLAGARGLRVRCMYTNPTDATIGHGPTSADEMCTMLAYTSAPRNSGGLASSITTRSMRPDGTPLNTSTCLAFTR